MTTEKMKEMFEKDGWNSVTFRELEKKEAAEKGYLFAINTNKKFFVMIENGNIYDERGKIAMFNITCCK